MALSIVPKNTLPAGGDIQIGFGGHIAIIAYYGRAGASSPEKQNWNVDVAEWYLQQEFIDAVNAYSGSYGSRSRRIVCCDWKAKIKIFYDSTILPEEYFTIPLKIGDAIGIRLYKGWGSLYEGYTAVTNKTFFPYYSSPSCIVSEITTLNNSEGDGIIEQFVTVKANSLIFDVNTLLDEADYESYIGNIEYRIPSSINSL